MHGPVFHFAEESAGLDQRNLHRRQFPLEAQVIEPVKAPSTKLMESFSSGFFAGFPGHLIECITPSKYLGGHLPDKSRRNRHQTGHEFLLRQDVSEYRQILAH